MTSTIIVLVALLILPLLSFLCYLFACSMLAKRTGQQLKSVSRSSVHAFSVEFYEDRHETET
jgi:hypothetical protein